MLAAFRRGGTQSLLRQPVAAAQVRSYAESKAAIRKLAKRRELDELMSRTKEVFKTYKPISPGIRHLRRPLNPHIWEGRPVIQLTIAKRKKGGRNSSGRITVRHRGGGHRQRIRTLDFRREEPGVHDVVRIEYDPGRSAHIALLKNRDPKAQGMKKWNYIVAPREYVRETRCRASGRVFQTVFVPGLDLKLIPIGTVVHNICLQPDGPAILVRSAGSAGQVVGHDGHRYTHVRLQSGEVRKVLQDCCATIGRVSNPLWKNRSLGKAGRARWLGRRPSVRGVAMNANDHPHGGGRGRSKSNKHPVSIWGWSAKGTRTRKPGPKGPKNSNKMVIRERPRGQARRSN
ncbi:translation protein SH3-like domain-containing protein [Roridomyces roridus]|uniref:Large ribosomal subunit protein uL2m n=1 Tax=Roridomyces roridus TaxID=1738132 RepID=A0AAD7BU72_9AGAR|nr:translation protein SH3-like domain-containing protein [Roridomyces roridus]